MVDRRFLPEGQAVGELKVDSASWLLSLPENDQIQHFKHHIHLLEKKRNSIIDATEAAHMAQIIVAARRYLETIERT